MMELAIITSETAPNTWTLQEETEAHAIDARLTRMEACPCGKPLVECHRYRNGKFDSIWQNVSH